VTSLSPAIARFDGGATGPPAAFDWRISIRTGAAFGEQERPTMLRAGPGVAYALDAASSHSTATLQPAFISRRKFRSKRIESGRW